MILDADPVLPLIFLDSSVIANTITPKGKKKKYRLF